MDSDEEDFIFFRTTIEHEEDSINHKKKVIAESLGKVHGSLDRAKKVRRKTPKIVKQDKKKKSRRHAYKHMQYNRRFLMSSYLFASQYNNENVEDEASVASEVVVSLPSLSENSMESQFLVNLLEDSLMVALTLVKLLTLFSLSL
ncbi:unnamed protein product [Vicia faba]|uniref:Uncharacterized protein n=1 Tax=Vicia faba TaxID=3906 RepID=A0AAV1AU57_VICFA|nr:unnamed protein product [Vicia faba]